MEILTVRWGTTFVGSRERKYVCVFLENERKRKEERKEKGKGKKGRE